MSKGSKSNGETDPHEASATVPLHETTHPVLHFTKDSNVAVQLKGAFLVHAGRWRGGASCAPAPAAAAGRRRWRGAFRHVHVRRATKAGAEAGEERRLHRDLCADPKRNFVVRLVAERNK